jgi:hypothetical protein
MSGSERPSGFFSSKKGNIPIPIIPCIILASLTFHPPRQATPDDKPRRTSLLGSLPVPSSFHKARQADWVIIDASSPALPLHTPRQANMAYLALSSPALPLHSPRRASLTRMVFVSLSPQPDKPDSWAGEVAFDQEKATSLALQAKLNNINREHGNAYIEGPGIPPRFDILKARRFDSSWNWVRQDALLRRSRNHPALHPDMLQFMQYNIDQCDASKGETYRLAKEFGQKLIDNTREVIGKPPMYKDGALHLHLVFLCSSLIFFL